MSADQPGIVAFGLLMGTVLSALGAAAIEMKLAQREHPRRALSVRIVPRSFADGGEYAPDGHTLQARGRKWFLRAAVFFCLFLLAECIGV